MLYEKGENLCWQDLSPLNTLLRSAQICQVVSTLHKRAQPRHTSMLTTQQRLQLLLATFQTCPSSEPYQQVCSLSFLLFPLLFQSRILTTVTVKMWTIFRHLHSEIQKERYLHPPLTGRSTMSACVPGACLPLVPASPQAHHSTGEPCHYFHHGRHVALLEQVRFFLFLILANFFPHGACLVPLSVVVALFLYLQSSAFLAPLS
mmetsp:Transcript_49759/g.128018  ORF Transcript_49759/g.128018 Transcript_49759/m.128018 type:complete len:204 (-) Transcript_49759:323-934(-)